MKKDNTIPFNPNNPDHQKGFVKWVEKVSKRKKPKYTGVLMQKKLYNLLKTINKYENKKIF